MENYFWQVAALVKYFEKNEKVKRRPLRMRTC